MMVPQTLPDGAQLEVVFTDNSSMDHTLTADLKGTVWPVGKTVTYKISSSSINWTYTLAVTSPADFTYEGGTQQYNVTSYRQNTKGVKEAVTWTAQYSEDGGASWSNTRPGWLDAFTVSGNGGDTPQSYNATVIAQTGVEANPQHTAALQNASVKGTETVHIILPTRLMVAQWMKTPPTATLSVLRDITLSLWYMEMPSKVVRPIRPHIPLRLRPVRSVRNHYSESFHQPCW